MKDTKTIKAIKEEMRIIGTEQNIKDWEMQDVEDMNGDDAFSRGYYRACEAIIKMLNNK